MKFPVSGSATLTYSSTSTFIEVTNAKRLMGGTTLASGRALYLRGFGGHLFNVTAAPCIILADAANGTTNACSPSGGAMRAMIIGPTVAVANAGADITVEFKPPGLKFSTECVVALANTTGVHHSDTCTGLGNVWGVGYLE